MSKDYDPDAAAVPIPLYSTVFLSQRDLQLKVPINFVTQPGVSFESACFSNLIFEDDSFKTCFSNLLAEGFRRFQVDLYWDQTRETWSLCPVSIPIGVPDLGINSTILNSSVTSTAILSDATSADATATGTSLSSSILAARHVTSSLPGSPVKLKNETRDTSVSAAPSIVSLNEASNSFSFPPYTCTATLNLPSLISILNDYIHQTENTLAAHLLYIILNIHAAASPESPTGPAPSPDTLPSSSQLLGSLFSANLSEYIYTPANLLSERTNLNNSWYTVPEMYRPASGYYNTSANENGIFSTSNGWPAESYIEFSKSRRFLLGYGSIDPQMSEYSFAGDESTIFSAGFIQSNQTIDISDTGDITNGCFLANLTNVGSSDINSSWATYYAADNSYTFLASDISSLYNLTTSLTACGISPLLNIPLFNTSVQINLAPYRNFSLSTIWSWAPGEPKNFSEGDTGTDSLFRCARTALYPTPEHGHGRWHVDNCSLKNYAACRIPSQPYNWTLTSYQTSYSYAAAACPSPYIFAAPRTALENAYLHQTIEILSHHRTNLAPEGNERGADIWLNFNSISVKECWVTGGVNATCPYTADGGEKHAVQKKIILVPTVAAFIVLVIGILTAFAKVGGNANAGRGNRRKKKRRMGCDSMFYEGVPS